MDKPDWKRAPDWARYLAKDQDGEWWWFQDMPEAIDGDWVNHTGIARCAFVPWDETLEQRP